MPFPINIDADLIVLQKKWKKIEERFRRCETKSYVIVILQSNVVQVGGVVEVFCLSSSVESRPKRSTLPLLFLTELSKSSDADGLFIGGEIFICKSKGPWIQHISIQSCKNKNTYMISLNRLF